VHCAVHLDIHIVADLVVAKVSCQVDVSFVPEWTREQVPGPRPQAVTSRHGYCVASSSFVSSLAPFCSTTREEFQEQLLAMQWKRGFPNGISDRWIYDLTV
jgi:hypothetical protein